MIGILTQSSTFVSCTAASLGSATPEDGLCCLLYVGDETILGITGFLNLWLLPVQHI